MASKRFKLGTTDYKEIGTAFVSGLAVVAIGYAGGFIGQIDFGPADAGIQMILTALGVAALKFFQDSSK